MYNTVVVFIAAAVFIAERRKMKKTIVVFLGVLAAVCALAAFAACGGGIGDITASFSDGRLILEWEGGGEAEVCRADTADGEYEVVASTRRGRYVTEDYASFYIVRSASGGVLTQTEPYCYLEQFGENVRVYGPHTPQEQIREEIDRVYKRLVWDEFSEQRRAFLFLPGDYAEVTARAGYYTTFAGLGYSPEEVVLKGLCVEENPLTGNSLVNFWRGAENFSVSEDAFWCVSQATFLRRMNFLGDLTLDGGGYSSGGFLADSRVAGEIRNSTQQQWFTRNSEFGRWTTSDINMVFSGVEGEVADTWPSPRNTIVESTPVMREKPFFVFDERQGFGVFVPDVQTQIKGIGWENGTDGRFLPIADFYIADARRDTASSLNEALAEGRHLLFTPGIYRMEEPLRIDYGETVVLGMGLATLQTSEDNTEGCVRIGDVPGVIVAGLLFDAGSECDVLMQAGNTVHGAPSGEPICLSDLFFRLGGGLLRRADGVREQRKVGAETTLEINADGVVGDNFWLWRADHGMSSEPLEPYTDEDGGLLPGAAASAEWAFWRNYCVGWKGAVYSNYGKNGIVVNGDGVSVCGLMVEHYGEYQTLWKGENGYVCFYQSETPYDAPDQAAWKDGEKNGFASYKVADGVTSHTAYGIGVYYVCNGTGIRMDSAIEAPSAKGIRLIHMAAANFRTNDGNGIESVINGRGKGVFSAGAKVSFTSFAGGVYTE